MKKSIITLLLALISLSGFCQKLKDYNASNGITYHVGDIIVMGAASGTNDYYVYMWISGTTGGEIKGRAYNGLPVTIKKIKKFKSKGLEKVLFQVGGGNIVNYTLDIENAIASCEIKDCNKNDVKATSDKYDQLKKLKELYDSGALTKEEFDAEKKKILEN